MHNGHNGANGRSLTPHLPKKARRALQPTARPLLCDPVVTNNGTKDGTLTDTALPGVTGQDDRGDMKRGRESATGVLDVWLRVKRIAVRTAVVINFSLVIIEASAIEQAPPHSTPSWRNTYTSQ